MDHLIFVKLAGISNFSFLGELEDTFPGGWGGVGGLTVIILPVSVQVELQWNLPTGTELGKIVACKPLRFFLQMTFNTISNCLIWF